MKKNEILCKVILLGETNVGKTNIISRIMSKPFNFSYETTLASTINYYSTEFTFGGTTYQTELKIWDTSGKQKYRSLNKIFFKDALVVLIVFNITNKNSYTEAIEYWLKEVKINNKRCTIYLVANFCDIDESYEVSIDEIKQFANIEKLQVYLVSARSNVGIKEMFDDIAFRFTHSFYYNIV